MHREWGSRNDDKSKLSAITLGSYVILYGRNFHLQIPLMDGNARQWRAGKLSNINNFIIFFKAWRDDRVAEGARLEIVCALIPHPGFDSLSLRQFFLKKCLISCLLFFRTSRTDNSSLQALYTSQELKT